MELIAVVRRRGVRLWVEEGQLRFKAPAGALTSSDLELLRQYREQLLEELQRETMSAESLPDLHIYQAPLAFSQLAHWHLYRLKERAAIRQITSATRLLGVLDVPKLQQSLKRIVCRHDALRTRIIVIDDVPIQEVSRSAKCELMIKDQSSLSRDMRQSEVDRSIQELALQPIDLKEDALCAVQLLRFSDNEHVLIAAMEHIIADAASMNIFLNELFLGYADLVSGQSISLPKIEVQFSEYAAWQRNFQDRFSSKHRMIMDAAVEDPQRVRFPNDSEDGAGTNLGWATVPVCIDEHLKARLMERSRAEKTTLVMWVFTVYVALVLRWCNVSKGIVLYHTDARSDPKVAHTIGYFASTLYVKGEYSDEDTFSTLLTRVTREYCTAHGRFDHSYTEAKAVRPAFVANPSFNWVPRGSAMALTKLEKTQVALALSGMRSAHLVVRDFQRDSEPAILLFEAETEVTGDIFYPVGRFSHHCMESFSKNFFHFLRESCAQPTRRVRDIPLL